jgi:hypothetical protein
MNDDERLIWGKYLSAVANSRRQELEALDELLNEIGKPVLDAKELQYDIMKVVTVQAQGSKGPYFKITKANNKNNPNYSALIADLKAHKGKLTRQGYFVFLFDDQETAGMKLNQR